MKKAIALSITLAVFLMPPLLWFGQKDDAPGVALIGFIIVTTPIIFTVIRLRKK
jgi:hypothetical protein